MTLKQKLQLQWQQLLTTKNKQKEVSKETSFLYAKTEAVASVFCLMCEGIDSQKQGQGPHDEAGQDHSEHDCSMALIETPAKKASDDRFFCPPGEDMAGEEEDQRDREKISDYSDQERCP